MIYRVTTYLLTLILCFMAINVLFGQEMAACAQQTSETISAEEISRLFHEANSLFADANKLSLTDPEKSESLYRKSLLRFERIIKEGGIENGKLYYNIGNIYFRITDVGRAILNYRRAEQYIGNDINLYKNLEFARNTRKDQIVEKQKTKILKTVFFWHYDLSSKTRLILFGISFGLIWFLATARIFFKKPFFKWSIVISSALAILFFGSLAIENYLAQKFVPGVIVSPEVVARKGNSESYEKSFREPLHAGTEFTVLENRGAWLRVELPNASICWLPSADVELVR